MPTSSETIKVTKVPKIGINGFVRRQTEDSKFSYFDGSDEELIGYVSQNWPLRKKGDRDGVWIVPIDNSGGCAQFYSAVVRIKPDMFFNASCVSRSPKEDPLMCVSAVKPKSPSRYAEIILYSRELLGPQLSRIDSEFEIVSINVSDVPNPPEHPYEIARKTLGLNGGPKVAYDPEEIAQSIVYWAQRVFCKPKFTRHIDYKIVEHLKAGNTDSAISHRRKAHPKESLQESKEYIKAVHQFLIETDNWYH